MADFGAKARGGRKKLFDDRAPRKGENDKETRQNQARHERMVAHINYLPKERYPMPNGAKVTFRSDVKKPTSQRTSRLPHSSTGPEKSKKSRSSDKHAPPRRKVTPRPQQTEYSAKHGWLTPWKKMSYPIPPAATLRETAIIEQWKRDQKKIREGPLFVRRVVDSGPTRVGKVEGAGGGGAASAFTSLATYSARYERRYRARPDHTGKLWLKPFLPEELWDIVDPSLRKPRTSQNAPTTNGATVPKTRFNIADFSDDESAGGLDDSDANDSEAEAAAEDVDNDFEEDESDNDDYNAEQYFDDGDADEVVEADAEFGDDHGGGEQVEEREFGRDEEFDV